MVSLNDDLKNMFNEYFKDTYFRIKGHPDGYIAQRRFLWWWVNIGRPNPSVEAVRQLIYQRQRPKTQTSAAPSPNAAAKEEFQFASQV
jgi:hypothetical protein